MINKKMMLVMLLSSMAAHGSYYSYNPEPHMDYSRGYLWGDTKSPRFRIPAGYEFETNNKLTSAYQNFLRFLDEENRRKGINTRYVREHFGEVPEYSEDLSYVPLWIEKFDAGETISGKTPKYFTKEEVGKLISEPNKHADLFAAVPKESIDKSLDSEYRLYFGSGNEIDNFIFKDKNSFDSSKTNKEIKHLIDGTYEIANSGNTLNYFDLKEEEYNKYFLDKNGNPVDEKNPELVKFVKDKLEKDSKFAGKIEVKDGELYIVEGGKDRKIFHNTYRISLPGDPKDKPEDNWFLNLPLTKIVYFKHYDKGHEIAYTDDSIIIRDVIKPLTTTPKIKGKANSWPYNFTDLTAVPVEKEYKEKLAEDYIEYRNGNLSEVDFMKRWSLSETDLNSKDFKKVLPEIYEKDIIVKKFEKNKSVLGYTLERVFFPFWGEVDKERAKAVYNGEDEEAKKLMAEKKMDLATFRKLIDDTKELNNIIKNKDIENKIKTLKGELTLKRISSEELLAEVSGRKMVKLGGIGRINKMVDLGEGYNILMITENTGTYSGKFGTNITLSPYAKLKNIDVVGVGRQESAALGNSGLSGITSLNVEVDTNKFNEAGHLYQHALKDTWEPLDKKDENGESVKPNRIVFRKAGEFLLEKDFRNDFVVQLNTSDIAKNGTVIDIGRPLTYKDDMDGYEYKLSLIPDTVVQDINILSEKSKTGNDLVEVKYKESIKLLSDNENKIFKSMVGSGNMTALKETLTTRNKKTTFSSPEADKANELKNMKLALALKNNKSAEEIIKELPEININEQNIPRIKKLIEDLENDRNIEEARGKSLTLAKYKNIDTSNVDSKLDKILTEFNIFGENIHDFKSDANFYGDAEFKAKKEKERQEGRKAILDKFGSQENVAAKVAEIKALYKEDVQKLYEEIKKAAPDSAKGEKEVGGYPYPGDSLRGNSWNPNSGIVNLLKDETGDSVDQFVALIANVKIYSRHIKAFNELNEEDDVNDKLLSNLENNGLFKQLRPFMFYTKRQAESIDELKIILSQIYDNNIYAKVNKISKNEINTFTPVVLESKYDFTAKKSEARGGAISGRFAREKFKGTVYSAYGMYEKAVQDNLSVGFVVGGANSKFHEIVNDDIKTVTTNSKIDGTSAYIGAFGRYNIAKNIDWISGLGVQYGKYNIERDMKNHYQQETYKGKLNTLSGNVYTGIIYDYKLNDTLDVNIKGGLSYTVVNQGKATEDKKPLSMEVKAQNFNYLDGQVGVGLTKTIYGNETTSSLSGMVSGVYGISGYDNDNLKGKFVGSNSDFDIKGEKYDKLGLKITLDYNMQQNTGFSYGLTGTYLKNDKEDNISVGVKAGYKF